MQQPLAEGETTLAMQVREKILQEMNENSSKIDGFFIKLKNKSKVFVGRVQGGWFIKLTNKKKKEEISISNAGMTALLKVTISGLSQKELIKFGKELAKMMDAKTLDSYKRKVKRLWLEKQKDIQTTDDMPKETENGQKEKPETKNGGT